MKPRRYRRSLSRSLTNDQLAVIRPRRLTLEVLEQRTLLDAGPSIIVSTVSDNDDGDHSPGNLSLREALGLAAVSPEADLIQFDSSLAGGTIELLSAFGQLVVDSDVEIRGLGPEDLTISANNSNSRVFLVASGVTAKISGLTLTGGHADFGGAIYGDDDSTLTVANARISGNSAERYGGGIETYRCSLTIIDAIISDNSAVEDGGGIGGYGGSVAINGTTMSGNSASDSGGAILYSDGPMTIANSAIIGNSAGNDGAQ